MRIGLHDACREHDPGPAHPDAKGRLEVLERHLRDHPAVEWTSPYAARRTAVETVHDPTYLDDLEAFCADGGGPWDADTVASPGTWPASLAAAGVAQWVAVEALETPPGRDTPFGLARPPGHHAMHADAMGFCFFNNVAIAAETLKRDYDVERVAILDWDVHHANGTEEYVINTDGVALISLHQQGLYPGTGSFASEIHECALNVPLPSDLGDAEYLLAIEEVVKPALETFGPDVILVSCGFDAHSHDVLASQQLSTTGYGLLADAIAQEAENLGAGLGFVLEGGYALDVIGDCAVALVEGLGGDVPERPDITAEATVHEALELARNHPLLKA